MATADGVKKLAALARIHVPEKDLAGFTKEFESILEYVSQLEKLNVPVDTGRDVPPLRNVMRDDSEPTETETYTKKIVQQFPESEHNALVVKQIISHD